MVYKIRNKSFFWTRAGWKNNWHPKNFNAPRPSHSEFTMGIRCRYDHHSFLRAYNSYRKISRNCRQYFYGSRELEEVFQMGLRYFYQIPLVSECPTHRLKHGGERRMVDQLDRDFELVSYNQHPYQIFTYETYNKYLAKQQADYEIRKNNKQTFEDEMISYLNNEIDSAKSKLRPGERLSIERTSEIVLDVLRKARAAQKASSDELRREDGEFNDYLEQRRPFVAPSSNTHSH